LGFLLCLACLFSCEKEKPLTPAKPGYLHQMIPYTDGQKLKFASWDDTIYATVNYRCNGCEQGNFDAGWYYTLELKDGNYLARFFIDYSDENQVFLRFSRLYNNWTGPVDLIFRTKDKISEFECDEPYRHCYDSVEINGRVYKNVLEIMGYAPHLYIIDYSKEKGILSFRFDIDTPITYYLLD
jgi:hypothetical protein